MAQKTRDIKESDSSKKLIKSYPEKAVAKEMQKAPERIRDCFITNLYALQHGLPLTCEVAPLSSLGHGVFEFKINGRPGWRCVYYTGQPGLIYVLHVCEKTTNGPDRQMKNVVEKRLKALGSEPKAE